MKRSGIREETPRISLTLHPGYATELETDRVILNSAPGFLSIMPDSGEHDETNAAITSATPI